MTPLILRPSVNVDDLLATEQAVLTDSHFVFTSGKHGDTYINARAYAHKAAVMDMLAQELAWRIFDHVIDQKYYPGDLVFIGPETLGRDLSLLAAVHFGRICGFTPHRIFCSVDETGAHFSDKLNFGQFTSTAMVYIDDLMNESTTFYKVDALIRQHGGKIRLACTIVNRQPDKNTAEAMGVEGLIALKEIYGLKTYAPEDCPLCAMRVPMRARPGHGKEWHEQPENAGYPMVGG